MGRAGETGPHCRPPRAPRPHAGVALGVHRYHRLRARRGSHPRAQGQSGTPTWDQGGNGGSERAGDKPNATRLERSGHLRAGAHSPESRDSFPCGSTPPSPDISDSPDLSERTGSASAWKEWTVSQRPLNSDLPPGEAPRHAHPCPGTPRPSLGEPHGHRCVPPTHGPPPAVHVHVTQHGQGPAVGQVDGVPAAQKVPPGEQLLTGPRSWGGKPGNGRQDRSSGRGRGEREGGGGRGRDTCLGEVGPESWDRDAAPKATRL